MSKSWKTWARISIPIIAGVILWAAAALKTLAGMYDRSGVLLFVLICHLEIFVGAWLISGYKPRMAAAVAGGGFAIFLMANLIKVIHGETACGCFGQLEVAPLYTLALDAVVAFGLWWVVVSKDAARNSGLVLRSFGAVVGVLVLLSLLWPQQFTKPNDLTNLTNVGYVAGQFVVLDPEKWAGKKMALISYIQDGKPLQKGDWIIILYRQDCYTCQHAIPNYIAEMQSNSQAYPKLALIEVPSNSASTAPPPVGATFSSELIKGIDWFVTTPVVIHALNGQVVSVEGGEGAADAQAVLGRMILDHSKVPN